MRLPSIRSWLLVVAVAALTACGTATNVVKHSPVNLSGVRTIDIREVPATVAVPDKIRTRLLAKLKHELYQENGFEPGNELHLEYRFVSYKPGNRLKRWLSDSTGNWGEGSLMVETVFTDASGKQVGKLDTHGKIESGVFGGAITYAANRVAENIAQHAAANYR